MKEERKEREVPQGIKEIKAIGGYPEKKGTRENKVSQEIKVIEEIKVQREILRRVFHLFVEGPGK